LRGHEDEQRVFVIVYAKRKKKKKRRKRERKGKKGKRRKTKETGRAGELPPDQPGQEKGFSLGSPSNFPDSA